jgi:hypothetical protein
MVHRPRRRRPSIAGRLPNLDTGLGGSVPTPPQLPQSVGTTQALFTFIPLASASGSHTASASRKMRPSPVGHHAKTRDLAADDAGDIDSREHHRAR